MLKRLASTVVGILLLFLVMFCKNMWVFNFALTLVCFIGIRELYKAFQNKGFHPIVAVGYLATLGVLFFNLKCISPDMMKVILIEVWPFLLFLLATILLLSKGKHQVPDVLITLFGILYIPFMLMFITFTRQLEHGELYVWYIFFGAWATDSFAYLIGRKFGKHHFSKISPKKTIEGAIAGIIFCAIFYGVYTAYLRHMGITGVSIIAMSFLGIVVSILSQIGDLTASAIKRFCDVKDFGKIMPGHGGVLDRFDSIIMISPFIYMVFQVFVK